MLYAHTSMGNNDVVGFVLIGQLFATRLLVRLGNVNTHELEADKS